MAIDIRGLGNQDALSQIAKLAYGSGALEKTSGGKGNIGLLDGRVVKFNTHYRERGGVPSEAMRANCNALRTKLSEIATSMLSAAPDATPQQRATSEKALASVRKLLGVDAAGGEIATTSLLDRKVVAKVINTIDKATGFDAWEGLRAEGAASFSSKGIDTAFNRVSFDVRLPDVVADVVAEIAHPADGKPGAAFNEEKTTFLTGLIQRDVAARRAAGLPVPTLDSIRDGIRNFTSPHLVIAMQSFYLDSIHMTDAREGVREFRHSSVYLSGSPREQRADRADVALSLLAEANDDSRYFAGFAMALVAEKMPAMRQIQPEGRLTGATVWRACFGESAPKAAGAFGSRTFSDAFFSRLEQLAKGVAQRHGGEEFKRFDFTYLAALSAPRLFNGMTFTAVVRQSVGDKTFVSDPARDVVSPPPLYSAADALDYTDASIERDLMLDLRRNFPIINMRLGDVTQTTDFRIFRDNNSEQTVLPAVHNFVARTDALFGDRITHAQRNVMFMGLTQAGFGSFMALVGVGGEHTHAQVDIRREDDGAVVMTYSSLPEDLVEARYSYRIEPDGTNYRVGEFVSRLRT